ncbi:hypothetical protein QP166_01545 [Sphingomonas sp. LR60]|uniref:hypothetical protein n=1 Tax=Sphingomonas sp. LR60 TaxID=3050233 RepID=UPI002FE0AF55
MNPTKEVIENRIEEFDRDGEERFLARYANGIGAKSHIMVKSGKAYPTKALWASAFDPPISPRAFQSLEAVAGLQSFGFECFHKIEPS